MRDEGKIESIEIDNTAVLNSRWYQFLEVYVDDMPDRQLRKRNKPMEIF